MARQLKISDFPERELQACQRVLIEILNLLKDHADHIALIGGWVPFYLMPHKNPAHIGSLDVDLCFDHANIDEDTYQSISEILQGNGYYQTDPLRKVYQWQRDVKIDDGSPVTVQIDLLAIEFHGTGKARRHQNIQDAKARKAKGSDLVFELEGGFEKVVIEGRLPNGAIDRVACKVAAPEPFIVMKGLALGRGKPKDAYDIEFVIANYPGTILKLVNEFQKIIELPIVLESLGRIRTKFESVNHTGPVDVVNFLLIENLDERAIRQRRAFEIVNELLDALNIQGIL